MKVYLEPFILDNMLMSYLIILASATLIRLETRWWGTLIACVASTAVSVMAMVNPFFLSLPVKLLLLLLMTLPFKIKKFRHLIRSAICIFGATNLFGGLAYALSGMLEGSFLGGVLYASGSMRAIMIALIVSTFIPKILSNLTIAKRVSCYDYELRITTKYGTTLVSARLDTGNQLRTAISDLPVIVVDATSAKKALPNSWISGNWADQPVYGMNFVPYKTVGGRGILPAMPARVEYKQDKDWVRGLPCCIGLSPHALNGFGALVNAEWLS